MCFFLPELIYEYKTCNNNKVNKHEYSLTGRESPSGFTVTRAAIGSCVLYNTKHRDVPSPVENVQNLMQHTCSKIINKSDLVSALKRHIKP